MNKIIVDIEGDLVRVDTPERVVVFSLEILKSQNRLEIAAPTKPKPTKSHYEHQVDEMSKGVAKIRDQEAKELFKPKTKRVK